MNNLQYLVIVLAALAYFIQAATNRIRKNTIDLLREEVRLQKSLVTYGKAELSAAEDEIASLKAQLEGGQ
jgi:hypothetical protein